MKRQSCRVFATVAAVILVDGGVGFASSLPFKGVSFYHNGSTMTVAVEGQTIQISYAKPRAGLKVRAGETLFSGRLISGDWSKGKLTGTAFVFKQGCESADYSVTGVIEDAGPNTLITLTGPAPVRSGAGCEVTVLSKSSPNANLTIESGVDE